MNLSRNFYVTTKRISAIPYFCVIIVAAFSDMSQNCLILNLVNQLDTSWIDSGNLTAGFSPALLLLKAQSKYPVLH